MLRAFLSERIKLRRLWMYVGVFGPVLLLAVASPVIQFMLSDGSAAQLRRSGLKSAAELAATEGLARVLTDSAAYWGVIVVAVFATGFATEFGWGTLRNLLVRQPDRARLLVGKFLGLLDFMFLASILSALTVLVTSVVMARVEGIPNAAWFTAEGMSGFGSAVLNLMLSAVGWASLGVLAAIVLRSPGPAVGVVLALFPIETLVGGWWDRGPRWLPGQLFAAVANGGSLETTFDRALALSLGYSLVAGSIAVWMFSRNDVTA